MLQDHAAQGGGAADEELWQTEAFGFDFAPVAEAAIEILLVGGEGFVGVGGGLSWTVEGLGGPGVGKAGLFRAGGCSFRRWCGDSGRAVLARDGLRVAEGQDRRAVAVGFFGADAGDLKKIGNAGGTGYDDGVEDGVGEDDEGRFAGLCGFGFAPLADTGFEFGLRGREGRFVGFHGGLAWAGGFGGARFGFRVRARGAVAEEDGQVGGLVAVASLVGEGGLLVGDDVAFRVGEGVGVEGDEAGAGECVEVGFELAAVDSEGEVGVELSGGAGGAAVEGAEDGVELAGLLLVGSAEGLGGGALGGAEVTVAARAEAVGGVTKVLDEGGHAALGGLGVGDHAVDLGAAEV